MMRPSRAQWRVNRCSLTRLSCFSLPSSERLICASNAQTASRHSRIAGGSVGSVNACLSLPDARWNQKRYRAATLYSRTRHWHSHLAYWTDGRTDGRTQYCFMPPAYCRAGTQKLTKKTHWTKSSSAICCGVYTSLVYTPEFRRS